MEKQIFVNLPVRDLDKTVKFFTKLGFKFNPQFTDENATCMVISENIFAMLLVEKFFKTFIAGKNISDAKKNTEVLIALNAESKESVDEMIKKAVQAGGKEFREKQDYVWMYSRSFEDLDGHVWEILYMDESKMPQEMKNKA